MNYDIIYHPFPINSQYVKTWEVDSPAIIIVNLTVSAGRGLGLGRISNLELEVSYFRNGKKGLGLLMRHFYH